MSTEPHFAWTGWHDGADDCDPPEPGKEWIDVTLDGEEFATIVLRTDASIFQHHEGALWTARKEREERAELIVAALNGGYFVLDARGYDIPELIGPFAGESEAAVALSKRDGYEPDDPDPRLYVLKAEAPS